MKRALRAVRAVAVLLLAAMAGVAPVRAEAPRTWLLSYEVLSSNHAAALGAAKPGYAAKERFTRQALAATVPAVFAALAPSRTAARSRVGPGGYEMDVSPAIQTDLATTEAGARRVAAALGLVFGQWAVLVSDLAPERANVRYISVGYPRGGFTPARAELFFARARAELKSDKLGFGSFGPVLLFINLNTGLSDEIFAQGLARAAATLPALKLSLSPPKPMYAVMVENDWAKAKAGEDYARIIAADAALAARLAALRQRHDAAVARWAKAGAK